MESIKTRIVAISSLVASALMLASCARPVWVKPGSNAAEFEQAKAECIAQAQLHSQSADDLLVKGFTYVPECLNAKGYTRTTPDAAKQMERSHIVWVKDQGYSYKQAHADFAKCKQWNPNEDGVAECMRKNGYIGVTNGALEDAAKKALADGTINKSVSSEAESDARRQKVIHIAISSQ